MQNIRTTSSKLELRFKSKLESITKLSFVKVRPHWLINPKTNRRLELDMYNDLKKIAIEYNGHQHYVYPNYYHKSIKEFNAQLERDDLKALLCLKNNVNLITIKSNANINNEIDQFYNQMKLYNIYNNEISTYLDRNY